MTTQPLRTLDVAHPGSDYDDFYRRVQPHLLAYVRRVFRPADAEEVTAETMARALEQYPVLEPSRSAWPWLLVVARRLACDAHRNQTSCRPLAHEELAGLPALRREGLEEEVVRRERTRLVELALAGLSGHDARLLRLRLVDGMSHEEIAVLQGASTAAVRQQYRRARERFLVGFTSLGGELRALVPLPALVALLRRGKRAAGGVPSAAALGPLAAAVALVGSGVLSLAGSGPAPAVAGSTALTRTSAVVAHVVRAAPSSVAVAAAGAAARIPAAARPTERTVEPGIAAQAGPAIAHATLARNQLAAGATTEHEDVSVSTPVGTVYVTGDSGNSTDGRVVCTTFVVHCG